GIRDLYVTGVQTCALPIFFYSALARPIMLNHLAAQVGLPGLYPDPMNTLRVMLGLHERAKPDLEGFRLVRNIPGQAKPAEKVARSEERRVGKEGRARR